MRPEAGSVQRASFEGVDLTGTNLRGLAFVGLVMQRCLFAGQSLSRGENKPLRLHETSSPRDPGEEPLRGLHPRAGQLRRGAPRAGGAREPRNQDGLFRGREAHRHALREVAAPGRDLVRADAREADFTSADLRETVFTGANLKGARFVSANLNFANLAHADARRADFSECDFGRANFHNLRDDSTNSSRFAARPREAHQSRSPRRGGVPSTATTRLDMKENPVRPANDPIEPAPRAPSTLPAPIRSLIWARPRCWASRARGSGSDCPPRRRPTRRWRSPFPYAPAEGDSLLRDRPRRQPLRDRGAVGQGGVGDCPSRATSRSSNRAPLDRGRRERARARRGGPSGGPDNPDDRGRARAEAHVGVPAGERAPQRAREGDGDDRGRGAR